MTGASGEGKEGNCRSYSAESHGYADLFCREFGHVADDAGEIVKNSAELLTRMQKTIRAAYAKLPPGSQLPAGGGLVQSPDPPAVWRIRQFARLPAPRRLFPLPDVSLSRPAPARGRVRAGHVVPVFPAKRGVQPSTPHVPSVSKISAPQYGVHVLS